MIQPLNLARVREELAAATETVDMPEGRRDKAIAAWANLYGFDLLTAARLGLDLSRNAACSERTNQAEFLNGLFDDVEALQSTVCDGKKYMQRRRPTFGIEREEI